VTDPTPPQRDVVSEVVGWAVDHVEVDANFEGVSALLVGDPQVLDDAPVTEQGLSRDAWSWLDLPLGRALLIRAPGGDADGPWVWVFGSDDGPLSSIGVSPRLEPSSSGSEPEHVGAIRCLTGRVVIGSPASIALWGSTADVSQPDRLAEMRVGDAPDLLRNGYSVIARCSQGDCDVVVSPGASPGFAATIEISLPVPSWLPPPRPMIEREDDG